MSRFARLLARFVFGHDSISRRLEKSRFVQDLSHRLRMRAWINSALRFHPIRRQLEPSKVKYQIETFEALAVERMYFGQPIYTEILRRNPPLTFIDLGCNSGIFPCFLAHLAGGREVRGLCLDANAEQIELARKSGRLNSWPQVYFRHGLVGNTTEGAADADFFLNPTSLGSSQFPYAETESGRATDWKRIQVPSLNVGELWTELFGPEQRCDCLKIDIEGSEMQFLRQEESLLARVDSILIEWHAWTTTSDEITATLGRHGFVLDGTIESAPRHGVLFFHRPEMVK